MYTVVKIADPNLCKWSDTKDWYNQEFNVTNFNIYLLSISENYKNKPCVDNSLELIVEDPFILEINNAYVYSLGVVFNEHKQVVQESLNTYYDWDPLVKFPFYFRIIDPILIKIFRIRDYNKIFVFKKKLAFKLFAYKIFLKYRCVQLSRKTKYLMFFDHYYYNFTHFIIEAYPRLYNYLTQISSLERDSIKIIVPSKKIKNDTNYDPWGYIEPCLQALNITEQQRVYLDEDTVFLARDLILPSQIKLHPKIVASSKFLVNKFKICDEKYKEYEKIYVSRGKANRRKITNEAQYLSLLHKHGYKEVIMEEISFKEKINIMQAAKIVVTIDSSSATNIIFSNPGTKVLILTFECMPLYNLFISSLYNIDLCYQICQSAEPVNHTWYNSNMIVDIDSLEDKLVNWAVF